MNETGQQPISADQEWNRAYAEIEAAFQDIDPDGREALYARASQILDDIHRGRF